MFLLLMIPVFLYVLYLMACIIVNKQRAHIY